MVLVKRFMNSVLFVYREFHVTGQEPQNVEV